MAEPTTIICNDLDEAIEENKTLGYRLDMIFPADSPREALMSRGEESLRLLSKPYASAVEKALEHDRTSFAPHALVTLGLVPPAYAGGSDFVRGRAGMEYRDLIPGRLGGKVIVSHIRLPFGGEVPDSVHYHKIDFQMIYCVRGRIQVVYEDQGPPFWLETGDCILQPPEIRHRVLFSGPGAEVIEVSSPAEHETWIDHEMTLPNGTLNPKRDFGGQRFHHFNNLSDEHYVGSGYSQTETKLWEMSGHKISLMIKRFVDRDNNLKTRGWFVGTKILEFVYLLSGDLTIVDSENLPNSLEPGTRYRKGDCFILPERSAFTFDWSEDLKLLDIIIPT